MWSHFQTTGMLKDATAKTILSFDLALKDLFLEQVFLFLLRVDIVLNRIFRKMFLI